MNKRLTSAIMFHTVGHALADWTWKHLTVPWTLFEGMLKWLKRMHYRTVLLDEYREVFLSGRLPRERIVALTFDDGYLDNWVYAAPLLEKYGFCGTVFVSGDFIDPGLEPRPQWDGKAMSRPFTDGFLNIGELRKLDASGVIDVQSHCMTHTWYPSGPQIVDFRHPGDSYPWMDWNRRPEDKWRKIQPDESPSNWGEPVYEHQKALNGPRYFPDEHMGEALKEYANAKGKSFFSNPGWREELRQKAAQIANGFKPGRFEDEEAFARRVEAEISEAARILGDILNKKIRYLCWPGGGYSNAIFDLAAKYYAGTTISTSFDHGRRQGTDKLGCFRFARTGPLHTGDYGNIRYLGAFTNYLYLEEHRTGGKPVRLLRGGLTKLAQWGII